MLDKNRFRWYIFFLSIVILILVPTLAVKKTDAVSLVDYNVPNYKLSISESTQLDIWKLCEENHLSYELVLAIFHIEGNNTQFDSIKVKIEKLAYYRNFWAEQGYPDEIVFNLMLFSREREIKDGKNMMDKQFYTLNNYVQRVTEYKYYLEQSLDYSVIENGQN